MKKLLLKVGAGAIMLSAFLGGIFGLGLFVGLFLRGVVCAFRATKGL